MMYMATRMKSKPRVGSVLTRCRLLRVCALVGVLLATCPTFAQEDWKVDLEIYGWLPTIDNTLNNGFEYEITSEDLLKDIDLFLMTAGRIRKNHWSFALDLVYAGAMFRW